MKQFVLILIICLMVATAHGAIQLKPAPVQDALDASVALFAMSDDFGTLNEPGDKQDEKISDGAPLGKSAWKAGLLSALVPGAGEFYLGNRKKARYFFVAETLTWIGYLSFRIYGDWKEDDYIRYAATHANIGLAGRDDEFHDAIGFYNNRDEYNTIGRIYEPEREYLEDIPANHWQWTSEQDRHTFRQLKNSSRESYRRADFMIGVAIVGRIISVIDAVRDAKRMQRRLDRPFTEAGEKKIRLSVNPFHSRNQFKLTLATGF